MHGKRKIAQFRTHDLTKGISYVSTQSQVKFQWTLKLFKRNVSNWPDFEYSRMKFPSLSRGCESESESTAAWRTKNSAISHPLLNEGTFIREYSTIRLLFNRHWMIWKKCVQVAWLLSTHVCQFLR